MGVHHVGGACLGEQGSDIVRLLSGEGLDVAATQEAPQLRLPERAAGQRDYGRGRPGHDSEIESSPVAAQISRRR